MNKKALLLGNGVNRVIPEEAVSWSDLLGCLKSRFNIKVELDNPFKPFPLAFDEMQHRKPGQNELEDKLKQLKQCIREAFATLEENKPGFNHFHRQLIDQQYSDILTTNYDYSLQLSVLGDEFYRKKQELSEYRLEKMHSLKRRYCLPDMETRVWHIHGELFDSRNISEDYVGPEYHERSILIGYEQYSEYLELIQNNFYGLRKDNIWEKEPLKTRILSSSDKRVYWTDILFTHDVDIVGLGFEFSESHLWWLMKQRAKLRRNRTSTNVSNQIRFFYADISEESAHLNFDSFNREGLKKLDSVRKSKAVAEVLSAFDVEPVSIRCESHRDFYDKLFQRLND